MAKMLGQDLFTQREFDKFKKEYEDLEVKVKLQEDKIKRNLKLSLVILGLNLTSLIIFFALLK